MADLVGYTPAAVFAIERNGSGRSAISHVAFLVHGLCADMGFGSLLMAKIDCNVRLLGGCICHDVGWGNRLGVGRSIQGAKRYTVIVRRHCSLLRIFF